VPDAVLGGAVVTVVIATIFVCGLLAGTSLQSRHLRRLIRRLAAERRRAEGRELPTRPDDDHAR